MKEDFLHYVWKFQKLQTAGLQTVSGDPVTVQDVGVLNQDSGPDFFNARVTIDGQSWAGNVEIHLKSSDWYAHHHEKDQAYDTVILHVVYEHDAEIFRKDNTVIPTISLKNVISKEALKGYRNLFNGDEKWINCENDFAGIDPFVMMNWLDRLFFERLETKSNVIFDQLEATNNDWEAVLFRLLAKGFGLKVNADSFLSVASSVDFSIIKKCSQKNLDLEAVLLGQAGILSEKKDDKFYYQMREQYQYLRQKFKLRNEDIIAAKFFRLRPPNFPTIRLSQLASLYSTHHNMFSKIIQAKALDEFYDLFYVSASNYWNHHFNFGVTSNNRRKGLTKKFVSLLLLNVVIPIKFCYAQHIDQDITEELTALAASIPAEQNSIITKFNSLWPDTLTTNAMQTQAVLQLKKQYCDPMHCLQCTVGNSILKQS